MSTCNHCGRYTADGRSQGSSHDCKYCKAAYEQGKADGERRALEEIARLRKGFTDLIEEVEKFIISLDRHVHRERIRAVVNAARLKLNPADASFTQDEIPTAVENKPGK